MIKDFEIPKAELIAIAMVPTPDLKEDKRWQVFFVNLGEQTLETVIIQASGEGIRAGKEKETAVLRFMLNTLPPFSAKPFEWLLPESLALSHRYWVSYFLDGKLYDKKFMVPARSIQLMDAEMVDILGERAVLFQ